MEHVADIISKYMVGVDGKTAYERLFGRPVREEALEFGETVHWRHRPACDMNVVLDVRWSSGVWLGRKWGGVIHQVFAAGHVCEIRSVQRQPRDLRWRREALEAIAVTPWAREPAAHGEGELRVLPPLAPPAAAQGAPEEEVHVPEYNPHRVFIRLEDLETHGFTAGCRRCILMREGRKSQGIKHRDECRNRVEQAMRDADDPRLHRAEHRALDELERRAAEDEPPAAGASDEERARAEEAAKRNAVFRSVLQLARSTTASPASSNEVGWRLGVGCASEQEPNPASRVTLSDEKDALGLNRTKLAWRLKKSDADSLRGNLEAVARAFGGWGEGRVQILFPERDEWTEAEGWGNHHLGTTRMAVDPRRGVVDAECRVHGISNLFIAGSSLFPTGSTVNPTLTLVALALRLSDHLKRRFASNASAL